jgi:hypothetical protein
VKDARSCSSQLGHTIQGARRAYWYNDDMDNMDNNMMVMTVVMVPDTLELNAEVSKKR